MRGALVVAAVAMVRAAGALMSLRAGVIIVICVYVLMNEGRVLSGIVDRWRYICIYIEKGREKKKRERERKGKKNK